MGGGREGNRWTVREIGNRWIEGERETGSKREGWGQPQREICLDVQWRAGSVEGGLSDMGRAGSVEGGLSDMGRAASLTSGGRD